MILGAYSLHFGPRAKVLRATFRLLGRTSDAFLSFAIDLKPFPILIVHLQYRCVQTIVNREVPSLNWYYYSNCTKLFSMDNGPVSSLSVTPVANGGSEPLKMCQVGARGRRREGGRVSMDAFVRSVAPPTFRGRFFRISSQSIFPTLIVSSPLFLSSSLSSASPR